jgi:hypothetical protein
MHLVQPTCYQTAHSDIARASSRKKVSGAGRPAHSGNHSDFNQTDMGWGAGARIDKPRCLLPLQQRCLDVFGTKTGGLLPVVKTKTSHPLRSITSCCATTSKPETPGRRWLLYDFVLARTTVPRCRRRTASCPGQASIPTRPPDPAQLIATY